MVASDREVTRDETADLLLHAMFQKVQEAEARMRRLVEHLRDTDPYRDNEQHSVRADLRLVEDDE